MSKLKLIIWGVVVVFVVVKVVNWEEGIDYHYLKSHHDVREKGDGLNANNYIYSVPLDSMKAILNKCFEDSVSTFRGIHGIEWHGNTALLQCPNVGKSYVYKRNDGTWFDYKIGYILKLVPLADDSTMLIVRLSPSLLRVRNFGFFKLEWIGINRPEFMVVPSSTIEEYELLKYIGECLGEVEMPPVKYPKAVSVEDIKKNAVRLIS